MLSLPGSRPRNGRGGLKTLVVGAGEAGRTLARALRRSPNYGLVPIGFLDDAPGLRRAVGLPVFGPISALPEVARARQADACVVAIPSLPARPARRDRRDRQGLPGCTSGTCRRSWPRSSAMHACPTCASSGWETLLGRHELHVVSEKAAA